MILAIITCELLANRGAVLVHPCQTSDLKLSSGYDPVAI